MQPTLWKPPSALSTQEEQVVSRIRRAKLFVFLRHSRHELFDEPFQQELATTQPGQPGGGIHPSLLHNWLWRPFFKHTRASRMMK